MTGLRDLLKKRDKFKNEEAENRKLHSAPEVTIIRSDTHTQEILNPPSFNLDSNIAPLRDKGPPQVRLSHSRSPSTASKSSRDSHGERKLSSIFHFRSHSKDRPNSENVPGDLPSIVTGSEVDSDDKEAQWEKRATILAQGSANLALESQRSIPEIPMAKYGPDGELPRSRRGSSSEAGGDDVRSSRSSPTQTYLHTTQDDIQKAIRLHESGDLKASTAMFGRLADPRGGNNALSQVLYGLALRHGWGIDVNLPLAISYLSKAAENSSIVESEALASGMKKGGVAKGELVLAIFELGNCFRNGWGIDKDAVAARSYYETAANCGDMDAMIEVARCYEEGFGTKKDKFKAATYYRKAEDNGNKIVGNSWIWKDKYNPK